METFVSHVIGASDDDSQCQDLLGDPSLIVPVKPCVWMSVNDHHVALIHGYNVASMTPPVFFMAGDAIPADILSQIKQHDSMNDSCKSSAKMKVTLSIATVRELPQISQVGLSPTCSLTSFADSELVPQPREGYPSAVASSPIHMFGFVDKLINLNPLPLQSKAGATEKVMVLLHIEVMTFRNDILSIPRPSISSSRKIVALIDALKLEPLASLGQGQYATIDDLYSLDRPSETDDGGWKSDHFLVKEVVPSTETTCNDNSSLPDFEWVTSDPSPFGYDPIKAIVIPRPIGWISTYYSDIAHVAPYSFFMDVGHADASSGSSPMVAFAVYRPNILKDVQLDIQETNCFGVNAVTPELAVAMNLSSAPIPRDQSEFDLSALQIVPGSNVQVPLVKGSPITMECLHVKTVDVGSFSVVIGKVVALRVSKTILTETQKLDVAKLQAVTRLGYMDEYAVIDKPRRAL